MQDLASNSDFSNLSPEAKKKVLSGLPGFPQSLEAQNKIYSQFGITDAEKPKEEKGTFRKALDWTFGIGDEYKHKGLVETGFNKLRDYGKKEGEKRQNYRSSQEYYDKVIGNYKDQLSRLESSKESPEAKKSLRKLIEEEKETRLNGKVDATIEQFAPHALQTSADILQGSMTPKNAAIGTVAAVYPPARLPIGAYYAGTGLWDALKPRKESEDTATYLERVLQAGAQTAGGAALGKSRIGRTLEPKEQLSKLTSVTDKEVPASMIKIAIPELNETAKETGIEPKTPKQYLEASRATGKRLNIPYDEELAKLKKQGQQVTGHDISKMLREYADSLSSEMGPEKQEIIKEATKYEKAYDVDDLDKIRKEKGAEARRFHRADTEGKIADSKQVTNGKIASIVEQGIQKILYDDVLPKSNPNVNWRELKSKQQAILHLTNELDGLKGVVEKLNTAQESAQGQSRIPGVSTSLHEGGITPRVHLGGKALPSLFGPEVVASRSINKAFRGQSKLPKRQLTPLTKNQAIAPSSGNPPSTPSSTPPKTPKSLPLAQGKPSITSPPSSLAGPKLGPGAEGLGGTTRSISIDGKPSGHITYEAKGDTLVVHDLGGPKQNYNAMSNTLGRKGVAELTKQLKEAHPEVKYVEGIRVGGALGDEAKSFRQPIERLPGGRKPKLTALQTKEYLESSKTKAGRRVALNGVNGSIIGKHPATGKVVVKLEDGSIKRVDPSEINPPSGLKSLK